MNSFDIEWLYRILAAMLSATIIGYERHRSFKEAGVRTHVLVALSTCLLMIISKYGFMDSDRIDASRIAAGAVSGISFLGAGIIFERRGKIEGLTTAAGVFATGAIGMCFGCGMYYMGIISSVLTLAIGLISPIFNYIRPLNIIKITVLMDEYGEPEKINDFLSAHHLFHAENHIRPDEGERWRLDTEIAAHDSIVPKQLVNDLKSIDHVIDAKLR